MALLVLKTTWGAYTIQWIGDRLEEYISYTKAGSVFAFGEGYMEHQFVFGVNAKSSLVDIIKRNLFTFDYY